MIISLKNKSPISFLSNKNRISRESVQRLDLLLLALETIDINGIQSLFSISNKLMLNDVLPSKISIWKLRNNNPMRKSYISNKIKFSEFDALIKLAVEMSKYLYPYIWQILKSRDDIENNPEIWNDFKKRFLELINERFNVNSIRVKKLVDPQINDKFIIQSLLTWLFVFQTMDIKN